MPLDTRLRRALALLPAALIVAAAGAALLHGPTTTFLRSLDTYNPTPDLARDVAIGLLVGGVIGYSTYLWPASVRERVVARRVWWLHMAVVFGPLLYLGSVEDSIDGFRHYRETVAHTTPLSILQEGADTAIVNVLLWFPLKAFAGSYTAAQLLFVLPTVVAALVLARAARRFTGKDDPRPLLLFALFPSFLIWGSFLNKEGLTVLAVALYLFGVIAAWSGSARRGAIACVAGLAIAAALRPWLVFLMVAPLIVFAPALLRTQPPRRAVPIVAVTALGSLLSLLYVLERFRTLNVDDFVQRVDEMSHHFGANTSTGRQAPRFDALGDVLGFLPWGIFTLLFRPLPGEGTHPLLLGGGLESLVLLLLLGGAIAVVAASDRRRLLRSPLVLWLAAFVLLWAAAYTFPLYQNAGLAWRTRTMILPAMLMIPIILLGRSPDPARLLVLDPPGRWRELVRTLSTQRPAAVVTRGGAAPVRGQLAALLMGVPRRVHERRGARLADRLASALATEVRK